MEGNDDETSHGEMMAALTIELSASDELWAVSPVGKIRTSMTPDVYCDRVFAEKAAREADEEHVLARISIDDIDYVDVVGGDD